MSRRTKIVAVIGTLWGAALVVQALVKGVPAPNSSYGAGAFVAFLFGVAMLLAGTWTLFARRRN